MVKPSPLTVGLGDWKRERGDGKIGGGITNTSVEGKFIRYASGDGTSLRLHMDMYLREGNNSKDASQLEIYHLDADKSIELPDENCVLTGLNVINREVRLPATAITKMSPNAFVLAENSVVDSVTCKWYEPANGPSGGPMQAKGFGYIECTVNLKPLFEVSFTPVELLGANGRARSRSAFRIPTWLGEEAARIKSGRS